MPENHYASFVDFFLQNIDKIKNIPKDSKIKDEFFKSDFDMKNYQIVDEASKRLKFLSKEILNRYKFYISDMVINDTHNAGINNGDKIGSRYNHDIEGRIPDFLNQLITENPEINAEKLAEKFILQFYFWTDCYCCAKRYPMHVDLFTKTIRSLAIDDLDKCKYPQGIMDQKYSFTVKSGKLIFGNDFRSLFPHDDFTKWALEKTGQYQTVNTGYGSTLFTEFQMEKGLIYISTGNSCPSVKISNDKKSLAIACGDLNGYDNVESVCTDLWAVQALDYDHFVELCGESDIQDVIDELGAFVVDVENGEYEIIDHNKYPCKEEYSHFATFNLKS